MGSGPAPPPDPTAPRPILVAGTAAHDFIYQYDDFPARGTKALAKGFTSVGGGSAGNAAVAISRLGGRARLVAPIGDDLIGDLIVADLEAEGVDISAMIRFAGAASPVSAAIIDGTGERTILTSRPEYADDPVIADPADLVADASAVLADDRFPAMVRPLLAAARALGLPAIIDGDRAEGDSRSMLEAATHVVFSAAGLKGTTGIDDLEDALKSLGRRFDAFFAVTIGAKGMLYLDRGVEEARGEADGVADRSSGPGRSGSGGNAARPGGSIVRHLPAFKVEAVDTLGAGDVFHGGFALALVEGRSPVDALRFGAAVAAVKCTRHGGRRGAPTRREVEGVLGRG